MLAAFVVASALPLFWPDVPPLLDLPGHMGRYRVQLELATSPTLQQYYGFDWALIGNLGDRPSRPAAGAADRARAGGEADHPADSAADRRRPALGRATRCTAGFRRPPCSRCPFVYNYPFLFGFVNFALAMALALLAFALWLRLARLGRLRLRAALFVPISVILWVVHAFGWGTLGVLAFSAELVRQHDRGRNFIWSGFRAGLPLPGADPAGRADAALAQRGCGKDRRLVQLGAQAGLADHGAARPLGVVRHRLARPVPALIVLWALVEPAADLFAQPRRLGALPDARLRAAAADRVRLGLCRHAARALSVRDRAGRDPLPGAGRPASRQRARRSPASPSFSSAPAARRSACGSTTGAYDRELAALDHVPHGARMVSFVGRPCVEPWAMSRLLHLPGMAIVRRHAFSNDQWTMAGAQLLHGPLHARLAVHPRSYPGRHPAPLPRARSGGRSNVALANFPRDAFDYVWLIQPPPYDASADPRTAAGLARTGAASSIGSSTAPRRAAPPGTSHEFAVPFRSSSPATMRRPASPSCTPASTKAASSVAGRRL